MRRILSRLVNNQIVNLAIAACLGAVVYFSMPDPTSKRAAVGVITAFVAGLLLENLRMMELISKLSTRFVRGISIDQGLRAALPESFEVKPLCDEWRASCQSVVDVADYLGQGKVWDLFVSEPRVGVALQSARAAVTDYGLTIEQLLETLGSRKGSQATGRYVYITQNYEITPDRVLKIEPGRKGKKREAGPRDDADELQKFLYSINKLVKKARSKGLRIHVVNKRWAQSFYKQWCEEKSNADLCQCQLEERRFCRFTKISCQEEFLKELSMLYAKFDKDFGKGMVTYYIYNDETTITGELWDEFALIGNRICFRYNER